jgi:hypothetical protein
MSASNVAAPKRRGRTPSDSTPVSGIPTVPLPARTPALDEQQLRVLHQVYRIVLAHGKGAR